MSGSSVGLQPQKRYCSTSSVQRSDVWIKCRAPTIYWSTPSVQRSDVWIKCRAPTIEKILVYSKCSKIRCLDQVSGSNHRKDIGLLQVFKDQMSGSSVGLQPYIGLLKVFKDQMSGSSVGLQPQKRYWSAPSVQRSDVMDQVFRLWINHILVYSESVQRSDVWIKCRAPTIYWSTPSVQRSDVWMCLQPLLQVFRDQMSGSSVGLQPQKRYWSTPSVQRSDVWIKCRAPTIEKILVYSKCSEIRCLDQVSGSNHRKDIGLLQVFRDQMSGSSVGLQPQKRYWSTPSVQRSDVWIKCRAPTIYWSTPSVQRSDVWIKCRAPTIEKILVYSKCSEIRCLDQVSGSNHRKDIGLLQVFRDQMSGSSVGLQPQKRYWSTPSVQRSDVWIKCRAPTIEKYWSTPSVQRSDVWIKCRAPTIEKILVCSKCSEIRCLDQVSGSNHRKDIALLLVFRDQMSGSSVGLQPYIGLLQVFRDQMSGSSVGLQPQKRYWSTPSVQRSDVWIKCRAPTIEKILVYSQCSVIRCLDQVSGSNHRKDIGLLLVFRDQMSGSSVGLQPQKRYWSTPSVQRSDVWIKCRAPTIEKILVYSQCSEIRCLDQVSGSNHRKDIGLLLVFRDQMSGSSVGLQPQKRYWSTPSVQRSDVWIKCRAPTIEKILLYSECLEIEKIFVGLQPQKRYWSTPSVQRSDVWIKCRAPTIEKILVYSQCSEIRCLDQVSGSNHRKDIGLLLVFGDQMSGSSVGLQPQKRYWSTPSVQRSDVWIKCRAPTIEKILVYSQCSVIRCLVDQVSGSNHRKDIGLLQVSGSNHIVFRDQMSGSSVGLQPQKRYWSRAPSVQRSDVWIKCRAPTIEKILVYSKCSEIRCLDQVSGSNHRKDIGLLRVFSDQMSGSSVGLQPYIGLLQVFRDQMSGSSVGLQPQKRYWSTPSVQRSDVWIKCRAPTIEKILVYSKCSEIRCLDQVSGSNHRKDIGLLQVFRDQMSGSSVGLQPQKKYWSTQRSSVQRSDVWIKCRAPTIYWSTPSVQRSDVWIKCRAPTIYWSTPSVQRSDVWIKCRAPTIEKILVYQCSVIRFLDIGLLVSKCSEIRCLDQVSGSNHRKDIGLLQVFRDQMSGSSVGLQPQKRYWSTPWSRPISFSMV